jgi:hypothetical protein
MGMCSCPQVKVDRNMAAKTYIRYGAGHTANQNFVHCRTQNRRTVFPKVAREFRHFSEVGVLKFPKSYPEICETISEMSDINFGNIPEKYRNFFRVKPMPIKGFPQKEESMIFTVNARKPI